MSEFSLDDILDKYGKKDGADDKDVDADDILSSILGEESRSDARMRQRRERTGELNLSGAKADQSAGERAERLRLEQEERRRREQEEQKRREREEKLRREQEEQKRREEQEKLRKEREEQKHHRP